MVVPAPASPTAPNGKTDPAVNSVLTNAARACQQAVVDYRSGLLDDAEMQRALVRSGMVVTPEEIWLLDVANRRWWRYDGAAPTVAHPQPDPGVG